MVPFHGPISPKINWSLLTVPPPVPPAPLTCTVWQPLALRLPLWGHPPTPDASHLSPEPVSATTYLPDVNIYLYLCTQSQSQTGRTGHQQDTGCTQRSIALVLFECLFI